MSSIPGWKVEQNMAKNRAKGDAIAALQQRLKSDNLIGQMNRWVADAPNAVRRTEVQRMASERETERALAHKAAMEKKRAREVKQDVLLAQQIQQQNAADVAQQARIQQIIESDQGLKALEVQLRTAYANKERALQLEAKAVAETLEAEAERAMDEAMERDRVAAIAADADKLRANAFKRREMKNILQHQISAGAATRLEQGRLEYEKDRRDVDAIVAKIRAEDTASEAKQAAQREDTRTEIAKFNAIHAAMVQKARNDEAEEIRKIAAYQAAQDARLGAEEKKKEAKAAEEERIYQKLLAEQQARDAHFNELEQLRETLSIEENEQRIRNQEEAKKRKNLEMKRDMIRANEQQKREKAQMRSVRAREEEVLIRKMRDKFDADEAKERDSQARRKVANLEHRDHIARQQRQRKDMYEHAKAAELAEQTASKDDDEFRRRVVAEARRRLLVEHASKLQGFMPNGVLESTDERDLWSSGARHK